MEQNFQTSFIPKKSIVKERTDPSRPVSFLNVIAIFILFAVVVSTGLLYFYKGAQERNISKKKADLALARDRFEPARIAELQDLDRRLQASSELLSRHISVTPIFKALGEITMKTVRYTKFGYNFEEGAEGTKILVRMNGTAIGYRSVALQADLFTQNRNFIDPVFSNLKLDDKGNVVFDLDFSVDPAFVDYKQTLLTQTEAAAENIVPAEEVGTSSSN